MALDFIQEVNSLSVTRQHFFLNPQRWGKLDLAVALQWQRVEFVETNKQNIPASPGIYAFVVSNRDINIPANGYIMYIGIVGYKIGSPRNLRMRFMEYISEQRKLKRAHIHIMLNKWKGHIDFHYAELSPEEYDLQEIEKKLCGALIPPCNKNDFDAVIKPIVEAARL